MGWGGLDVDTEEAFLEHAPGVAYIVMIKGVWDGVAWTSKPKGHSMNMLLRGGLVKGGSCGSFQVQGGRGWGVSDVGGGHIHGMNLGRRLCEG